MSFITLEIFSDCTFPVVGVDIDDPFYSADTNWSGFASPVNATVRHTKTTTAPFIVSWQVPVIVYPIAF